MKSKRRDLFARTKSGEFKLLCNTGYTICLVGQNFKQTTTVPSFQSDFGIAGSLSLRLLD